MPTASAEIGKLDRMLANRGEDVVLQRGVGAANRALSSVTCRAFVRDYQPNELIAGGPIMQGDSHIIMSATQIDAAQWPGGTVTTSTLDPRIPVKPDVIIAQGRTRTVQAAHGIYIGDTLVRIEAQVRG